MRDKSVRWVDRRKRNQHRVRSKALGCGRRREAGHVGRCEPFIWKLEIAREIGHLETHETSNRSVTPEASPPRRAADLRRSLHNDESGALQVLHKPLGHDLRHDLICVVDALAALVSERIGKCAGEVGGFGGCQSVQIGHQRDDSEAL